MFGMDCEVFFEIFIIVICYVVNYFSVVIDKGLLYLKIKEKKERINV